MHHDRADQHSLKCELLKFVSEAIILSILGYPGCCELGVLTPGQPRAEITLVPFCRSMSAPDHSDVLDRLMAEILQRAEALPQGSYTTQLIRGGIERMGAKILEEANEVVQAARDSSPPANDHLIYEACDLIYHLWVLLGSRGVTVNHLRAELARREGTSGLDEKRSRNTADGRSTAEPRSTAGGKVEQS